MARAKADKVHEAGRGRRLVDTHDEEEPKETPYWKVEISDEADTDDDSNGDKD